MFAALLVLATVVGSAAYFISASVVRTQALSKLQSVANAKQQAIELLVEEYLRVAQTLADAESSLAVVMGSPVGESAKGAMGGVRRVREDAQTHMGEIFRVYPEVIRVEIFIPTGTIMASSASNEEAHPPTERQAKRKAARHSVIGAPFLHNGKLVVVVKTPVRGAPAASPATLSLTVDARRFLAITGDYRQLGRTGETVLGTRVGTQVHFLAPLRFDPNLEIGPAPASGRRARPMIHATAGQSGVIEAPDYRDEDVVAAYRPIANTSWGLVVKEDKSEIYADLKELQKFLLMGAVLMLIVSTVTIRPVVRRFVEPLRRLADAAREVSGGDLTVRVPLVGGSETEQLARAFNEMVINLRRTREELSLANRTLETRANELERVNGEIESFTYSLSHDLKAPLISIHGMSNLLHVELAETTSEDVKEYFAHIDDPVKSMGQLLEDLFELSRVGRMDTTAERVEPNPIVERAVAEAQAQAGERDIEFVVSEHLPSAWCNSKRLYQVFSNLIGNAAKFTTETPAARIEVEGSAADGMVTYAVRDNGPGIAHADHAKVFKLFYRRHAVEVPGSGMGLTFSKRIVESMGGKIWIESAEEGGTTFYVRLPVGSHNGPAGGEGGK